MDRQKVEGLFMSPDLSSMMGYSKMESCREKQKSNSSKKTANMKEE